MLQITNIHKQQRELMTCHFQPSAKQSKDTGWRGYRRPAQDAAIT
jgi:hypothetical protein